VFDDDLDDPHHVDDHVLDEEQRMLFEELNQEAQDSEVEKDALFQGLSPVLLLAVGNRLLIKNNRLLLAVRCLGVTGYFISTTGY
jgi:hypothetical protein